jgi:Glycosyl transferases group 1
MELTENRSHAGAASRASKRVLMLSIVNPIVERNGASTVTRGLLKLLASPPFQAQVECVPVRQQPVRWHRLAQARSLVRSSLSSIPAKPAYLYSRVFREKVIARMRSEHYDLVILNGADLLWIADYLPESCPRILVAHNIEHQLFVAQVQNIGGLSWPFEELLRAECKRLKEYELNGIRTTGNVIFLSDADAIYVRSLCEGLRTATAPPVFDYEPVMRQPRKPGSTLEIGLLGNFGWWPNRLGLHWFAHEVLPHVKSPVRLNLFGPPAGRGWRGDPRILEHGMIEGIRQVWEHCDFMICPAFSTGGVCVKLAEAAYNRMPVLATSHAARGLPIGEDPALVFLDEPGEWIEFLNSTAARQLAERQVSEKTGAMFAVDAQREALQQFVSDVISPGFVAATALKSGEAGGLCTRFR